MARISAFVCLVTTALSSLPYVVGQNASSPQVLLGNTTLIGISQDGGNEFFGGVHVIQLNQSKA
jgi:hypothetical protein